MHLPHNAAVLVADGRKILFLRNEGDDAYPNLVVEHAEEQANPKDSDQKTDAPGLSFSSVGSGRSTMDEVDFHQQEEDRFAARMVFCTSTSTIAACTLAQRLRTALSDLSTSG